MGNVRLSTLLTGSFEPVHRAVQAGVYRHYWLKGGRGSGKSSFVSLEIILGMMRNPGANAIVYRRWAHYLRGSVYEQLLWAVDRLGVSRYWRAWRRPLRLEYRPTGQQALFLGADDPVKSKSIKLAHGYFGYIWFEELAEYPDLESVRSIIQSVARGGGQPAIFYTYNPPKSAQSWVNAEAMRERPGRLVHHSSYLDVPRAWLGEVFLAEAAQLKDVNETAYRHEYLGEVTGTGGQVFDNLELRPITGPERAGFDRLRYGLDFGFAVDPDALLAMHYSRPTRTLYILDEYYRAGGSVDQLAEAAKKLAGSGRLTADSEDPRMIAELRRRGLSVEGAKKGPGSVEHGMRWLQDLGRIVIDPKACPNAAREFAAYEYERDRWGNFRARYPDRDNHAIDAARYGCEDIMTHKLARVRSKSGAGLY